MAISKNDLSTQLLKSLAKDFEVSYNSSDYTLRKQCDRLSGYAHLALELLEAEGKTDFLFLKHDDMRQWWIDRKEYIRKAEEAVQAKLYKAELKARALLKLTDEEKKALGLKK